ncbi:unnamed protein product [Parnassius mnemosyne]|uniref:Gag-like protein n=1 Tax=Parnassius mnemosyne TaxID=213953 RepID=A0AAV1KBV7_9NEOP
MTVQKLPTKNPLLRLIGVAMDLSNNKIEEAVIKQNGSLLKDISTSQTHIKVVRRVKGRTGSLNNIIVEVSPQVWSRLKDQRIRLGFQIVPSVDQSPLIQCYRCLGFSHRASECKADTVICAYCAEPHDTRDCRNKNEAPKCTNCINKKANDWACAHPAYSSECPEWQRWDRIARSFTSYC